MRLLPIHMQVRKTDQKDGSDIRALSCCIRCECLPAAAAVVLRQRYYYSAAAVQEQAVGSSEVGNPEVDSPEVDSPEVDNLPAEEVDSRPEEAQVAGTEAEGEGGILPLH